MTTEQWVERDGGGSQALRRWTIELPDAPYVTPNARVHWSRRASSAAVWRQAAKVSVMAAKVPACGRVEVSLTMFAKDRVRRDEDNLVSGVLKHVIDGIVDAGVVPDDAPEYVRALMPTIVPPTGKRRLPAHAWMLAIREVAA
jgi:crossover junction endodeoxyribonuclease RusA